VDHPQLGSIDLGRRLAAYFWNEIGSGQHCDWPLNADPSDSGDSVETPLPQQELLSTFAEMGIAIVGFAVVADIFRPRTPQDTSRLYTLRDVADIGLTCAVMSAFPLVVHGLGVPAESSWRLASAGVLGWAISGIALSSRRRGRGSIANYVRSRWLAAAVVYSLIAISLSLALVNLVFPGPSSGARHVAWALAALTQSGAMFIIAIFDTRSDS